MIEIIKNEVKRFDSLNKEMFKGIDKIYDELLNLENYKWILENDDIEDKDMWVEDEVMCLGIRLFGDNLIDNLLNMGYKWVEKDEVWDMKNIFLSNYGLIWDYYLDCDTCVRERVSEELDRIMERRNMM